MYGTSTQNIDISFHPEVIVVGPDPVSGLLTSQFTAFYEMTSISSTTIDGPLGEVIIEALDRTAIVCHNNHHFSHMKSSLSFDLVGCRIN